MASSATGIECISCKETDSKASNSSRPWALKRIFSSLKEEEEKVTDASKSFLVETHPSSRALGVQQRINTTEENLNILRNSRSYGPSAEMVQANVIVTSSSSLSVPDDERDDMEQQSRMPKQEENNVDHRLESQENSNGIDESNQKSSSIFKARESGTIDPVHGCEDRQRDTTNEIVAKLNDRLSQVDHKLATSEEKCHKERHLRQEAETRLQENLAQNDGSEVESLRQTVTELEDYLAGMQEQLLEMEGEYKRKSTLYLSNQRKLDHLLKKEREKDIEIQKLKNELRRSAEALNTKELQNTNILSSLERARELSKRETQLRIAAESKVRALQKELDDIKNGETMQLETRTSVKSICSSHSEHSGTTASVNDVSSLRRGLHKSDIPLKLDDDNFSPTSPEQQPNSLSQWAVKHEQPFVHAIPVGNSKAQFAGREECSVTSSAKSVLSPRKRISSLKQALEREKTETSPGTSSLHRAVEPFRQYAPPKANSSLTCANEHIKNSEPSKVSSLQKALGTKCQKLGESKISSSSQRGLSPAANKPSSSLQRVLASTQRKSPESNAIKITTVATSSHWKKDTKQPNRSYDGSTKQSVPFTNSETAGENRASSLKHALATSQSRSQPLASNSKKCRLLVKNIYASFREECYHSTDSNAGDGKDYSSPINLAAVKTVPKPMTKKSDNQRMNHEERKFDQVISFTDSMEYFRKMGASDFQPPQSEQEQVLASVPIHIRFMYQSLGFCKDRETKVYLPVLCLNPFSMPPGADRDEVLADPSNRMGVYFYGQGDVAAAYKCIKWFLILPYENGVEKGYNKLPDLTDTNHNDKAILTQLYRGLQAVFMEIEKKAAERTHPFQQYIKENSSTPLNGCREPSLSALTLSVAEDMSVSRKNNDKDQTSNSGFQETLGTPRMSNLDVLVSESKPTLGKIAGYGVSESNFGDDSNEAMIATTVSVNKTSSDLRCLVDEVSSEESVKLLAGSQIVASLPPKVEGHDNVPGEPSNLDYKAIKNKVDYCEIMPRVESAQDIACSKYDTKVDRNAVKQHTSEQSLLSFTSFHRTLTRTQEKFYGALQQFTLSTNINTTNDGVNDEDRYKIPEYVVASTDEEDNMSGIYLSSASSEEESAKLQRVLARVLGEDYQNGVKSLNSCKEEDRDKYAVD